MCKYTQIELRCGHVMYTFQARCANPKPRVVLPYSQKVWSAKSSFLFGEYCPQGKVVAIELR